MTCDEALDLVTESLAAPLPRRDAAALEAHLAACAACRAEAWELRRTWKELERLPEESPSEEMSARFAAALAPHLAAARRRGGLRRLAERAVAELEVQLERWLPHRALAQAGVAAAALAVGVLLGAGHRLAAPGSGAAGATAPGGGAMAAPGGGAMAASESGARAPRQQDELAGLRQEVRSLSQLVTLSLLKQDSASERLRGVSFGREASASDERVLGALLDTLGHDSDVNVRLAAVDALAPTVGRPPVRDQLLEEVARQPSPMVQIALIDVLLAHDRAGSRRRLLDLEGNPRMDPTVRDYLRARLHAMS
jgi:hypothetical protein